MLGLMQQQPLLVSSIIRHAARYHGGAEVVSQMNETTRHRTTYATLERRSRRLARVLHALGVKPGDRVGTLAWNTYRHLELFYAISGSGAVCHTINPRLAQQDIKYIITHAGDSVLFVDASFAELTETIAPAIGGCVHAVVMMTASEDMPEMNLPAGIALHCYETLMQAADEDFDWPIFDENTAGALCYTSGTTGQPKGVLYSHRSTVLHAYAANTADAFGLRAVDRMMPGAPMFHAAAWSVPYTVPMVGAALILPGRHLDPASLVTLLNDERVTMTGAVPTVWLAVLGYLGETGQRLPHLRRIFSGGSAVPRAMIEGFAGYGIEVQHGWGMTETSPLVSAFAPMPNVADCTGEPAIRVRLKQGRPVFGTEVKIVGADGQELPWDGIAFGDLLVRGPWVCRAYLHRGDEGAADAEGWFSTGDVATIDPNGFIELVDRSKDVIKSGGEWISSIALENIAVSHPDVAEAAVINARHAKWMERPLLLVVPKQGRTIDTASVLPLYDGAVAKWWFPDAVIVVDELPHTATGKLNKLALRQRYQDHLLNLPPDSPPCVGLAQGTHVFELSQIPPET
ncbi:MAG TPA: long-chain fatty acid--CoA ligase [Acetobacteraceae bacterium]|nr:long-chain fatty acid--CoA ligase [Acetobacteraceae bacterium]